MKKTFGQILWEAYIKANEGNGCSYLNWNQQDNETKCSLEAAAIAVLAEPIVTLKQLMDATTAVDFQALYDARANARELLELMSLPEPIDPYADLKAAHAAGKAIQSNAMFNGRWMDEVKPMWNLSADQYRIKPWQLTRHLPGFQPLEDGEEWHRQDFTEEMLPDGWRPLLLGEPWAIGDQIKESHRWRTAGESESDLLNVATFAKTSNCRTRRPLPPTKAEKERKEFEEWAKGYGYDILRNMAGMLIDSETHNAWIGWHAARKQKEVK